MAESTEIASVTKEKKYKLTPKELIFKYIIYLPLFIFSISVAIFIAFIYLRYQIPYYSSGISIIIRDDKGSRGTSTGNGDALDDVVFFKSKTNLANEIEILKSAALMDNVVKELNLNTQYIVEGNFKRSETYNNRLFNYEDGSVADSNAWFTLVLKFNDKKNFQIEGMPNNWYKPGDVIHGPQGDFKITLINPAGINPEYKYIVERQPSFATAGALAGALSIRQLNTQTSILRITITTEIAQKGVDILNQLVKAYNNNTVENKNKVIDNTIKFIDNRLLLLAGDLGKVEKGLQEYREKNEIIDIEEQGASQYGRVQTLEEAISGEEVKTEVLDMLFSYINNPSKKFSLVPSSLGIDDPTLNSLITSYNSLQLEREQKLKAMPEANPIIQNIESQLEKVRLSIIENLKNIRRSSVPQKQKLATEYNKSKQIVRSVPNKQRELLEIARQQGIKEKLYLFLLQKREESAITMAATTASSYSIDPASSYWLPVSPDRNGTFRTAIIIGIFIPIGFIYLRELLNDKVVTKADVTKSTDMPIIGEISHHKMADREVVVGQKDRSLIAEQFRIARTNLQYFITNKKNPVILVTSTMAGEGKTFTSMNLGAVWAVANKKTVILELDLRKPKISKALNLLDRKGISNYIIGDATKEELPVAIKGNNNLYIVPAGPIPPNPSELLLDEKIDQLFEYLRTNFDIIIIDSAPLGLVSDAKVLSRFADVIVYVARQRYTPKKQMEFINELYQRKTFEHISLLINDVKMGGYNSYYGYGYSYGYGTYGYGEYAFNYSMPYGYGEFDKKKGGFLKRIFGFLK